MCNSAHQRPMFPGAAALACALAVSSCAESDGSASLHVDNLPDLASVEAVRIGSADDPVTGLSRIRRVRLSDKGDVYVLEASASEVRVFSSEESGFASSVGVGRGPESPRPRMRGMTTVCSSHADKLSCGAGDRVIAVADGTLLEIAVDHSR